MVAVKATLATTAIEIGAAKALPLRFGGFCRSGPRVLLYQSIDIEVVSFTHLSRGSGGHQFDSDVS
jgi:hypothetical protein